MIDAGERRLPTGPRGQGWIRQSRAVLPVVARVAGGEGVTGGELRGGGGFGRFWGLELRWFSIVFERWGGSARFRGVERWLQADGGGSGCNERDRNVAAAELTGEGEDGLPWSIAGYGSARWMA